MRALLRKNVELYTVPELAEDKFTDDQLIDFILQYPILMNRPIVVTPMGTRLCRLSEVVLDILPDPQPGAFARGNGEPVVDEAGKRLKYAAGGIFFLVNRSMDKDISPGALRKNTDSVCLNDALILHFPGVMKCPRHDL